MSDEIANGRQNSASSAQRDEIIAQLLALIAEALPASSGADAAHVPFLEMGANSLVLLEFQRTVESIWGVTIQLPQFFEELTTIDALATYLEGQLDECPTSGETPVAAPILNAPALSIPDMKALGGVEPGSELEQIFNEQMRVAAQTINQVVEQQLQFLRQAGLAETAAPGNLARQKTPAPPVAAKTPQANSGAQPQKMLSPLEIRARGLSACQQQHLEALIERYTARTKKSKQHVQSYRQALADSRASVGFRFTTKEMLYPIVGSRASGARIWDIDDNEYVDITMGQGVNLFGHHPECIERALRAQPADIMQLGPRPPEAGEAAELICKLTGMDRVTFTNTGTEAVMAALRLARAATGRHKIAMFEGAYHGHADSVMGTSVERENQLETRPVSPGTPPAAVEDLWTLEYGSEQALEFIRRHGTEIAAVIVEPVQSRRPELQPQEFLHQLRRITRQTGTLLIFDEMITGFRIHPGGAQAFFGVEADIATYGKVLGGGMPIGVVAGRGAFLDPIDGGMWDYGDTTYPEVNRVVFGGTFCQHPLAMTTTRATLRHLDEQGPSLQQELNRRTARLAAELNRYFRAEEMPIEIVHFGSLFRFAFSGNLELLFYHMMEKGVFIWEWRNYFLSTAHTDADIDFIIRVVQESVTQMRDGGFIPERGHADIAPPLEKADRAAYPLNEAQQQLSALAQISAEGSMAYHVNALLELSGAVDYEALEAALGAVVAQHDALRTAFEGDVQRVLPVEQVDSALISVDLSRETEVEEALTAWLRQCAATPFELDQPPLFAAHLLKLGERDHRLALRGHHIVLDGLSMNLIVRQLAASYNARVGGTVLQLEPPLQYGDYLRWQVSQDFAEQQAYWLEQLQGELPVIELPADRPQPALRSYNAGRIALPLAADLFARVGELSRQQGCTHFITLFAAYALWLHRMSGQDDLLVGIPVAGRSLEGGDSLVGYCTHLVPVRCRIDWQQPFVDYLRTVRGTLLRAYQHQDYPFARLIEKMELHRDGRRAPLVSALFNLDRPGAVPEMTGLDVGWRSQPIAFTAFDLVFNLTELDDALVLECDYNGDIFEASTAERLVGHFHTLLKAIVANPEGGVAALQLMEEDEWRRVVVECNQTERDYPRDRCLHQLFEERAAADAQAIAVAWEGGHLSYGQLNARANQLAHRLRALGMGSEAIVGVYTTRSPETVVAILAALKAGGAYLPLDPAYPSMRLDFMLRDCGAKVLLTQRSICADLSPTEEVQVLCLDDEGVGADEAVDNLDNLASPDSLAYVIYTSGSTGKPKGTMIVHRGAVNYLSWALEYYCVAEGDGAPLHSSIGFDATITSLFAPLLCGRCLWLVPEEGQEIEHIKEALEAPRDWSLVKLTPAHLELVNAMIPQEQLAGLTRCLVLGGEALHGGAVEPWRRAAPQTRIVNEYGPTETVVGCCVYEVEQPSSGPVPIGRPIANTQVYILDRNFEPVPLGVTGELFIGGDGVARGYLNRPELTAESFIPAEQTGLAAASSVVGGMLYRTGDLARRQPDGEIVYLGRVDSQIKLRGFRVELAEIEQVILSCDTVRECAVLLDQRSKQDQRLLAYLVPSEGEQIDEMALRHYIARELPDYMMPAAFTALAAMPLTANGKVDRKALPAPQRSGGSGGAPARSEAEKNIAALWRELLEIDELGINDNFFDMGGHSLLVLPLSDRLQELFGRQISPVDIFRYPTIAALARHLGGDGGATTARRKRKGRAGSERHKESYRAQRQRRSSRG